MENSSIPIIISVIIAFFGSIGGVAALLKVNADNSQVVAEGASKVVTMMDERLDEQETRIDKLEIYISKFDVWADKLLNILDRAVSDMPEAIKQKYSDESSHLKIERPQRGRLD